MKNLLVVLIMLMSFVEMNAESINNHINMKLVVKSDIVVHKAPSQEGSPMSFYYDTAQSIFLVWFNFIAENTEIIITKDGEQLASDIFYINEDEGIECNMSECEKGEYVVYVVTDGGMQVLDSFYKE